MLLTFQMLSLHKLVMIRNIGWNSVPDSVAAKPNIQKIHIVRNISFSLTAIKNCAATQSLLV